MKILGNIEWIKLPELNISPIRARIDSGAAFSALHAFDIKIMVQNDKEVVRFSVNPVHGDRTTIKICHAVLAGWKSIKSSNGLLEQRPYIVTQALLGDILYNIEVTLTNRDYMDHRMLLGRDGIPDGMLVDPNRQFVITKDEDYRKICSGTQHKPLNIAVLASNHKLYSNMRILEAGGKRGHNMFFINISHCYIDIQTGIASIHARGIKHNNINEIDAVIPRIKPSVTFYGCALVRQFHTMGKFCLNDANAIANSRDKLKCLQILASKGIPMPATSFANSPRESKKLIELVGGAPLVIKLLEGTQGKGVVLVDTAAAATNVIGAFNSANANILVQEFIAESKGEDIRCFVIDGKVVASMMRKSTNGEFRANVHLGASVKLVKITPEERHIAVIAAKMIGLKVAGVDIIRSKKGPMILEINSSPGLEGIECATGKDIASKMIISLEKHIYGRSGYNM